MSDRFRLDHVAWAMDAYGEIWMSKNADRLSEIFSEDVVYAERPGYVLDGISELQRYWRGSVGVMKDDEFVSLPELFRELGGGHWIVNFRCSFRKPSLDRVHFEWAALVELNREGRIKLFDDTWKKIPRWKMLRPPAAEDAEDIGAWTCNGKASAAKSTRRRGRKRQVRKRDRWWSGRAREAFEEMSWE